MLLAAVVAVVPVRNHPEGTAQRRVFKIEENLEKMSAWR